ncbi:thermonuclease family protein [Methyloceanibacter methanicus]|uniref:thermonuclease family protein n=1 Tax=Methyloceanibacter methanicus TaxID=1774968 RepID=UPI00114CBA7C|nr:hypothetical protein [Methyloceanibacter methanicus]
MAHIIRPNFRRPRRHPRRNQHRRSWLRSYYVREGLLVLAIFAVLCAAYYVKENRNVGHPMLGAGAIDVIDGDTVRSGGQSYRLVGFNTPETGWRAACSHERVLATKAKARLEELVAIGGVDLQRIACACPAGKEGTSACNAGRLCARLKVNGQNVGSVLIAEGLAERYVCGATTCPPRRNWCGQGAP